MATMRFAASCRRQKETTHKHTKTNKVPEKTSCLVNLLSHLEWCCFKCYLHLVPKIHQVPCAEVFEPLEAEP